MSGDASKYVWNHSPYRHSDLLIHLAVADVANEDHDYEFWMKQKKLARKARVNRSTIIRWFDKACDDGFMELLEERQAQGRPNLYRFLMPDVPPVEIDNAPSDPVANARLPNVVPNARQDVAKSDVPCAPAAQHELKGELKDLTTKHNRGVSSEIEPEIDHREGARLARAALLAAPRKPKTAWDNQVPKSRPKPKEPATAKETSDG